MGLKQIILKLGVAGLRAAYAPMKLQKTRNRIVILSRQSDKMSMDIRMIVNEIGKSHPDVEVVALCKLLEDKNPIEYGLHMLEQMKYMASSKVVLLDGYCIAASILNHKPQTTVVQMWHALAAIKKFGYQTIDKPSGHSRQVAEAMCMHRNYDHVICASPATGEHFMKCFNISESQLTYMALPRVDEILRPNNILPEEYRGRSLEDFRGFLRNEYEIVEGREVILYVPTFRKDKDVELKGLIDAVNKPEFTLVIKAHPIYDNLMYDGSKELQIPAGLNVQVIIDKKYSSYQWMAASDRIITDYSALGVEAALLDKPLYYYVYDIDDYEETVGLNVNPCDEMPTSSAVTSEELKAVINSEYDYDKLTEFKNKYVSVDTDNCTQKLGSFLADLAR
ncbi:MAG: CDP-glycerol glycerophosphotransferase family protein [Eubacterium sp.]|nr:CDP-glycerol glycerophosphotransferase family protein [Candidatus Colimonas fimequi]